MHYPKWLYHRTEAAQLVQDPDEQTALGADWAETPAAFAEQADEPKPITRKRK